MYKLTTKGQVVIRVSDGANIPCEPENIDYVEYLAWVSAGGVPLPADDE